MAKRQLRVDTKEGIRKKLLEISGKKVNIVMTSGAVFFVLIHEVFEKTITVSDMRRTKSKLEIDQIAEIILDVDA
ncbi:MAG: hypothetical protein MJA30_35505 [Cytophagales bacterium]|nr:hypothetical protein [Cytophagales bacterium]